MGAVYQAEHTHMRKRLAVKVLHPEMSRMPEVVARFEREAMAAAHIDHPNVAAATDFGKLDDGSFFLVLEYVEGRACGRSITEGPTRARAGAPRHPPDRERARARPRARHRAPRSQARERDARRARGRSGLREGARLRHRQGPHRRADRRAQDDGADGPGAHAARDGLRHAGVHGAGASARPAGRRARRSLRPRRHDVRDDRRRAALRAREQGHAARDARDGTHPEDVATAPPTRTCPPRSMRSSRGSSRRRPRRASRIRRISSTRSTP